mgnify:CR=1 FL=1
MGECEVKARKGLIRVRATVRNGRISDISITGDFLVSPEDAVFEAEERLQGVEASVEAVRSAIRESLATAEIVGATVDDFIDAVTCAIRGDVA